MFIASLFTFQFLFYSINLILLIFYFLLLNDDSLTGSLIKATDEIHAFLLSRHGIYFQLLLLMHFDSAQICLKLSYLVFKAVLKLFQIYAEIQVNHVCSSLFESLKMNIYLPKVLYLYHIMITIHLIEFQGLGIILSNLLATLSMHFQNRMPLQHLNLNYESALHILKYDLNILVLAYAYLDQVW